MNTPNNESEFEKAKAGMPDLDPDISVLWKPLQRLFSDGNPVDPVCICHFELGPTKKLPFAAISKTRGNRLILWPLSDARVHGQFKGVGSFPVHHISLELANGQTHLTSFDESHKRVHESRGWKLGPPRDGMSIWLVSAFTMELLEKQVGAFEKDVRLPAGDTQRRMQELKRYIAMLSHAHLRPPVMRGNYLIVALLLLTEPGIPEPLESSHFPMGEFWQDWIEGCLDGDQFEISPAIVTVGDIRIMILAASPPGRLKADCFIGSTL